MDTKTVLIANMIASLSVLSFMLAYKNNPLNKINTYHLISQSLFSLAFTTFSFGYYLPTVERELTIIGNASMIFGSASMLIFVLKFCKINTLLSTNLLIAVASLSTMLASFWGTSNQYSNFRIALVTWFVGIAMALSSAALLRKTHRTSLQLVIAWFMAFVSVSHFIRIIEALDLSRAYNIETIGLGQSFTMMSMFLFIIVSGSGLILMYKESSDEALYKAATFDGLTGTFNRQSFVEKAQSVLTKKGNSNEWLAIVMIDVDHFKPINDAYGHIVGDDILKELTGSLQSALESNEFLGRYGGDEFIMLLKAQSADVLVERVEKMRLNIEMCPNAVTNYTATFGIACIPQNQSVDFDEIAKKADDALYRAKSISRNTVYLDNSHEKQAV